MITDSQYIEHEVRLRVLKETTECKFLSMQKNSDDRFNLMQRNFDERFTNFEKRVDDRFSHMDYKINLIIGIGVAALIIPIIKTISGIM